jgi:hypothetical protein
MPGTDVCLAPATLMPYRVVAPGHAGSPTLGAMRGLKIATPVALRVFLCAALGCVAVSEVAAQTLYDDRVVWELASWPDIDSSGAPLTQATSHEDWFYSITQSRTVLGVHDGFVAAGYTKYPDVSSTTCRASCFGDP